MKESSVMTRIIKPEGMIEGIIEGVIEGIITSNLKACHGKRNNTDESVVKIKGITINLKGNLKE